MNLRMKMKKIILVVDDKRDIRSFIRAILENSLSEYFLEIISMPSSDIALQEIERRNGNIDFISTNIHRSGINGYTFIEYVKANYPHIKILVCSAHAQIADLEKMFKEHLVDGFIRKPFRENEYKNKVRNIFDMQNLVRLNLP
ncbi:MAG: response regulator [Deltaproteobacteria bacterium]|nr:response regulator [Deltaproteobacteria bacterium]